MITLLSLYLYIFLFQQAQIRNLQADSNSHSEASIKSQFHDYVIVQLNTHKCTCVFGYPEGKLSSSAGLTPQKWGMMWHFTLRIYCSLLKRPSFDSVQPQAVSTAAAALPDGAGRSCGNGYYVCGWINDAVAVLAVLLDGYISVYLEEQCNNILKERKRSSWVTSAKEVSLDHTGFEPGALIQHNHVNSLHTHSPSM